MVVKNESLLIREALQSAKPYIDCWSIVDTGSTDRTTDIIAEEMQGIPGQLHRRSWQNYGYNRTEAIELAKQTGCDFVLILDADETLIVPEDVDLKSLDPDKVYWATIKYNSISYSRPDIISTKYNWRYTGVTHEYLEAIPEMPPVVNLPITIVTHPSRCTKSIKRCQEDVRLLQAALKEEPNNVRYVFYLAQSFRDSGETEEAIKWYQKRAEMGGWYEEVWYSYFQIGQLMEKLYYPISEVVDAYLAAWNFNPLRAEAVGALASFLRRAKKYNLAFLFSMWTVNIIRPDERLFIEDSYYQWRILDEYAISAYWVGQYQLSSSLCDFLLQPNRLPESEIERVKRNKKFAEEKLQPELV